MFNWTGNGARRFAFVFMAPVLNWPAGALALTPIFIAVAHATARGPPPPRLNANRSLNSLIQSIIIKGAMTW